MMIYPFEQITVTQLCKGCGVNRKSFYYHFRDKYDVINWIFDTEMSNIIVDSSSLSGWVHLTCISNYFYENRYFYKKSPGDHRTEILCPNTSGMSCFRG